METTADLLAIGAKVQDYFEGMYYGDPHRLRQAFHPYACLFGHLQGSFEYLPLNDWLDMVEKLPAPAETGEEFDMRIVGIDITGEAATVKVADLYRGLRFTDYLSLTKADDEWMIVNKTYDHD
jgi:protease I